MPNAQPFLPSNPPIAIGGDLNGNSSRFMRRLSAPILGLDPAGALQAANPAAEALFGLSEAELKGRLLLDFLDPYSRDKCQAMLAQAAETGSAQDWELDMVRPGELPLLVGFSVDRLTEDPYGPDGFVVICRDISRQLDLSARLSQVNQELEGALLRLEKAHRKLQDTQAQLVQAEKMRSLGQLVAGVAHEINNPLGFVKNNARFLAGKLPELAAIAQRAAAGPLQPADLNDFRELLQDFVEISAENLDGLNRIEQIVLALRSYSRLDEAKFKQADLLEGLLSTVKLVRTSCGRQIQILTEFSPLPLINCNPGELNQVFMNLLINAVQAIDGPGTILVKAHVAQEFIHISIQDNGEGMSPETLKRLGEPFFTTKPVGSGTGLGLAISLGIVQRHNGQIHFSSSPGQGTLVTLEIPILGQQESHR